MSIRPLRPFLIWISPCLLVPLSPSLPVRAQEAIDSPMYKDPDLPGPRTVEILPAKAVALWLKALERPEADLRCRAAEAIALAHRRGLAGLEPAVAPLVAALDRPDQHPAVRLAVARALITLEARQAAASLLEQARKGGSDLRELVEPALARWDYRPARAVWLERLADPATPRRSLILAVRGLGAAREGRAADGLRQRVLSDTVPGPVRLEAARALGSVRDGGLEKDAERLAADPSPRGLVGRLAAAALLRRHRGEEAVRILQRLLRDRESAVAAPAAARLLEIDPKLVVPALAHLLPAPKVLNEARAGEDFPDAAVRALAVEALFRLPTEGHVRRLADQFDDPHPDVRGKARQALHELATKGGQRDRVIAEATRALATQDWRGLEQATLLLTHLDHKRAAGRLVELLKHARPEVSVTAAWGLRKLAVRETLPEVLQHVRARLPRLQDPQQVGKLLEHEISQLNQFLGRQRYREADAVLRRFIPKLKRWAPEARAAAVWALGLIHEGKPDRALVADLEDRLNDIASLPPEEPRVRWMCAVTLGRMKAKAAEDSLRKHYRDRKPSENPVNNACGWAIERITGEVMPAPETRRVPRQDWFLVPND
jgi:HEAT repeat protein